MCSNVCQCVHLWRYVNVWVWEMDLRMYASNLCRVYDVGILCDVCEVGDVCDVDKACSFCDVM